MSREQKIALSLRKEVPPLDEGKIQERLNYRGRISLLRVEFPPGQGSQLQIRPMLRSPSGRIDELVKYSSDGDQFLAGSGTVRRLSPGIRCYRGDFFEVQYESIDDTQDRNLIVDIEVVLDGEN